MATQYPELAPEHVRFIEKQPLFFTGSAAREGRVNVSPKGMDSLRVLSPNRIIWANFTGSGNETAAHIEDSPRMTLMWCAFEGPPMIFRVYGSARAVHRNDPDWADVAAHFDPDPAIRQIFDLSVDLVQKSCGYAVPRMDFVEERGVLRDWAVKKGEDGLRTHWREKNAHSIDGLPTGIVAKNL